MDDEVFAPGQIVRLRLADTGESPGEVFDVLERHDSVQRQDRERRVRLSFIERFGIGGATGIERIRDGPDAQRTCLEQAEGVGTDFSVLADTHAISRRDVFLPGGESSPGFTVSEDDLRRAVVR